MTERTSYLTPEEVAAAQALPRDTPYAIGWVSRTQFSVARYSGGCTYNGYRYVYMPEHDELIRDDVLKLVSALRKLQAKAKRYTPPAGMPSVQESLL